MAEKDFNRKYKTLTPLEKALLVALAETQFDATLLSAVKCASDFSGVPADEIVGLVNFEAKQRRIRMEEMATRDKKVNAFMGWDRA